MKTPINVVRSNLTHLTVFLSNVDGEALNHPDG
eukprot:COSAG02_NODE_4619_length_5156_cov_4.440577_2_plen_33_part_00